MSALSNFVDGLELLVRQLDLLEVAVNTGGVGALWKHDVATSLTPGNQDLGQSVPALLGDGVQSWVGADLLTGGWDLVLRAQWGVGLRQDLVFEAVIYNLIVGKERMDLNLVDVRGHFSKGKDLFHAGNSEVRQSDSAGLSFFVKVFHSAPRWLGVLGQFMLDDILLS